MIHIPPTLLLPLPALLLLIFQTPVLVLALLLTNTLMEVSKNSKKSQPLCCLQLNQLTCSSHLIYYLIHPLSLVYMRSSLISCQARVVLCMLICNPPCLHPAPSLQFFLLHALFHLSILAFTLRHCFPASCQLWTLQKRKFCTSKSSAINFHI